MMPRFSVKTRAKALALGLILLEVVTAHAGPPRSPPAARGGQSRPGKSQSQSRQSEATPRTDRSEKKPQQSYGSEKRPQQSYGQDRPQRRPSETVQTDKGTKTTNYGRSGQQREEIVKRPDGGTTVRSYDENGKRRATIVKDKDGKTVSRDVVDQSGSRTQHYSSGAKVVTSPDGRSSVKMDANGKVVSSESTRSDGSKVKVFDSGKSVTRSRDGNSSVTNLPNGIRYETTTDGSGRKHTTLLSGGRRYDYNYHPVTYGRSRTSVYVPSDNYYSGYRSTLDDPWFWMWMMQNRQGNGGGYGNGGPSAPRQPQAPKPFVFDWREQFSSLPDGISTKKTYRDGQEWMLDYVNMEVMNDYSYRPGWWDGFKNTFFCYNWLNGPCLKPEAVKYDLAQSVRAEISTETGDILRALDKRTPVTLDAYIDKSTGIAKPYAMMAAEEVDTKYGDTDAICNISPGDVIELSNPIPETSMAYVKVLQTVEDKDSKGCARGSTVKMELEYLQEAQNSLVQRVERGLQKVVENKNRFK